MKETRAIIGGGVIGGGWAARFLLHGWDVVVSDPNPKVAKQIDASIGNARPMRCQRLRMSQCRHEASLVLHLRSAEAVRGADWIQESVPEDLSIKHKVIAEIQTHAPAHGNSRLIDVRIQTQRIAAGGGSARADHGRASV